MVLFFDTNAVIKRYVLEPGSDVVDAILDLPQLRGGRFISSAVLLETHAQLSHKWRSSRLRRDHYDFAKKRLFADRLNVWILLPVTNSAVTRAASDAVRFDARGVNGFDHLHIATALEASALVPGELLVFVTSDQKLLNLASERGLTCFDPEKQTADQLLALF